MPYFVYQWRCLQSPVQRLALAVFYKLLLRSLLQLPQFQTKTNQRCPYISISIYKHIYIYMYICGYIYRTVSIQYSCSQFPPISLKRAETNKPGHLQTCRRRPKAPVTMLPHSCHQFSAVILMQYCCSRVGSLLWQSVPSSLS